MLANRKEKDAISIDSALPAEISCAVFLQLDPRSLLNVMQTSRQMYDLANVETIYKSKHIQHFHTEPTISQPSDSYYTLFKNTYTTTYKDVKPYRRKWYSLIKEGDIERIRQLDIRVILSDLKNNTNNLLDWVTPKPAIADCLFEMIAAYYHQYGLVYQNKFSYAYFAAQFALDALESHVHNRMSFYRPDPVKLSTWISLRRFTLTHWMAVLNPSNNLLQRYLSVISINPMPLDSEGQTPIHYASKYGSLRACELLVQLGADIHHGGIVHPFFTAAKYGRLNILQFLFHAGAKSVDSYRFNDYTPIHISCIKNQIDCFKFLVDCGANLDANHPNIPSMIYDAAECGNSELLQVLLDTTRTTNPDNYQFEGDSPLYAATCQSRHDCMRQLLDKGANPNLPSHRGYTPIHMAAHNNDIDALKILLKYGANPNTNTYDHGWTPLHIACEMDHPDAISTLLNADLSLNILSSDGETPLMTAAINDRIECIQLLTAAGADLRVKRLSDQRNALHLACRHGHITAAITLIRACPLLLFDRDNNGDTPLGLAAKLHHNNLVESVKRYQKNMDADIADIIVSPNKKSFFC